ncbi:MAG: hypothetical protein IK128_06695 [Clostridiales bacterium]|nr:hypothetical protein [Clostridiales bacterium]
MIKTRKLMSAALAGIMLLSASSCSLLEQGKKDKEADPDDIIEIAEDFAKSVTTADADKILKNFDDISDSKADKFREDISLEDQDEDNVYLKEYIASTMEYEVDEDSVDIDDDTATCDIYITMVNYWDATGELAGTVDDFYLTLAISESTIKYTVALSFVCEDGEWHLADDCFDDLDKVFSYVDYEFDIADLTDKPSVSDVCWYNSNGGYVNTSYIELDVYFAEDIYANIYYVVSKDGEEIFTSDMYLVEGTIFMAWYAEYLVTDDYGDYIEPGEYTFQVYTEDGQWLAEATASVSVSSFDYGDGLLEGVDIGEEYTIYDDSLADIDAMLWTDMSGGEKLTGDNTYYADAQDLCFWLYLNDYDETLYYAVYYLGMTTSDTVDINVYNALESGSIDPYTCPDMSKCYEFNYSSVITPGTYVLVIAEDADSLTDPYIVANCSVCEDTSE